MVRVKALLQATITLQDPIYTEGITLIGRQEETIRRWAREHDYKTLRGFHMFLRSEDWSYYNVIEDAYK